MRIFSSYTPVDNTARAASEQDLGHPTYRSGFSTAAKIEAARCLLRREPNCLIALGIPNPLLKIV